MLKRALRYYFKLLPAQSILAGYLLYSFVGACLLFLPFSHETEISFLDNFFVTVSAMSTTGLATIDVGTSYTFWGELFILILIQIGGIGYMTFSSFIILASSQRLSAYKKRILFTTFSFPKDFSLKEFITHIIVFSCIVELLGSISLAILFKEKGVENWLWNGIFHSISAFCTAGFSLFKDGIMTFQYDFWINMILCSLMTLGGIGFIVFVDFYKRLKKQKTHLTFTSKVITGITLCFFVIGTLLFFEEQQNDHTFYENFITSFFQIVSACTTAGFNSLNIGTLQNVTLVLLIFFMVFGASPSGTGGGVKNTTFAGLIGLVKSTLKGKEIVSFWKNEIPAKRVQLATAIFSFYMFILTIGVFLMTYLEDKPFLPLVFETISALGTVGLSMGVTSDLTDLGKVVLIVLMFIGRAGVLTFGFALISHDKEPEQSLEKNELIF